MAKKYMVDLNEEELKLLNELLTSGTQRVRKITHACILLCASKPGGLKLAIPAASTGKNSRHKYWEELPAQADGALRKFVTFGGRPPIALNPSEAYASEHSKYR